MKDALGVEIVKGDTVRVISWGAPIRLTDTGRRATVIGFTRKGYVRLSADHDPIARGAGVHGSYLAVARRDGQPGHEGNR